MNIGGLENRTILVFSILLAGFGWLLYQSGLLLIWIEDEEYGHGLMVVGLLLYLLYRNRGGLLASSSAVNWPGVVVSLGAISMFLMGEVSGIAPIRMYSVWLFAVAVVLSIGGWALLRKLLIPLAIVFLLIPLPNVLGPFLTAKLQLISSVLGVWTIRAFGGVVFLEGNVIDMGGTKLLVAEACAGLRYLFPLMSIGAIAGYIMRAPVWMRWAVFLATIPVTILMNSFRIGVTGILTEAYGMSHTEGFLHFFEGWVVFIASLIILVLFAYILIRFTGGVFSQAFSFDHLFDKREVNAKEVGVQWQTRIPVVVVLSALVIAVVSSNPLIDRKDAVIVSKPLSSFPLKLGEWRANESRLPQSVEEVAGASEYYYGDFIAPSGKSVNLYISYYKDQKQGVAPHSPTVCIPGDGWKITSDEPVALTNKKGVDVTVSRLVMNKGEQTTIAYYWLKQGENVFSQQFMARLDLIRFAFTENRADAALVRMVTRVADNETVKDADTRLQDMGAGLLDVISEYVPD